ncbi:DUF871 domain-containing protein [Vagococcus lutrae]|uniref:DUF871 domain-containing protein n=1 Tax=Vagococcus lutrae TaxID=81947 RepID=UPI00288F7652|nr:MupG family TIM beta-alpha barrel fold protein [Vagococcus lutrae]MDT2842711.1 MupG family TIM beta-alpha barrel fold protein [Vagococcus lutrae]
MRKLGISIYPEKSTIEELKSYIKKAHTAGFSRIFSCLLSVDSKNKDQLIKEFSEINEFAKNLGFEIIIDISPKVFTDLGIGYDDLSFFKDMKADGIRLDYGYGGNEESLMTFNPHDLSIEVNMSNNTHYIETIMDFLPNQYNLRGCHNFYPHRYSGLNMDYFLECTQRFKKFGLKTAAFVTSQSSNSYGPWPVTEGLPTLEEHRDLPLVLQIKHFISLNLVDDIIISNCFASNEEFKAIKGLDLNKLCLDVELIENIPQIEKQIVLNEPHYNRGDFSGNLVRSTMSRVKYKGHSFEVFNTPDVIRKGDIIIESDLYGHYAGELQIALTDMQNTGKSNVVGKVVTEELFLLDTIKPWQKFYFRKRDVMDARC